MSQLSLVLLILTNSLLFLFALIGSHGIQRVGFCERTRKYMGQRKHVQFRVESTCLCAKQIEKLMENGRETEKVGSANFGLIYACC